MTTIEPFSIRFDDDAVADLRERLRRTRWPEEETVDDWSQGVPRSYLRQVTDYWCDDYDFAAAEARLNAHPQFRTTIDELGIHFVHARSPHPDAVPIVLTHGWPGSFVEFSGTVDLLTDPADPTDAFDVVVPSLPGYGYSDRPGTRGWNVDRIATAWVELMDRLGYDRFAIQGGDWGAIVSCRIAQLHPDRVIGFHTNMPFVALQPEQLTELSAEEGSWLAAMTEHQRMGRGYSEQQATRPQTLGYGLTDSPAGQCAWILEKFWAWTDNRGHPEDALTKEQMLDNISVYWFTATAAASARLYWESLRQVDMGPVDVPTGVSVFAREIFPLSERWCRSRYTDLRHYAQVEQGGHFAAFEQPQMFTDELRRFFRGLRPGR